MFITDDAKFKKETSPRKGSFKQKAPSDKRRDSKIIPWATLNTRKSLTIKG
ncbi:Hypothetical protein ABZS17G119_00577 [Kosakonia cowanii]